MQFYTVLTSKGTTTIPSRVRRELNLSQGDIVEFNKDSKTGKFVISRVPTLAEIQQRNHIYIIKHQPLTDKQADKIVAKSIINQYKKHHDQNN